jgi:putative SOS response-associated peptidase YedK
MCGRFVIINGQRIFTTWGVLMKYLIGGEEAFSDTPRYNAAPMQSLPVVAVRNKNLTAERMQWWLVPHSSTDGKPLMVERNGKKDILKTFNAQAERLTSSKLYAPYFKRSRCLIPADAYYEWQNVLLDEEKNGKAKVIKEKHPYCIKMKDGSPFMMAGLFSVCKRADGTELPTFTIITVPANSLTLPIHARMPAILPERFFEQWLDRENSDTESLAAMLKPFDPEKMIAYRVSNYVSNSRNEGEACMAPFGE